MRGTFGVLALLTFSLFLQTCFSINYNIPMAAPNFQYSAQNNFYQIDPAAFENFHVSYVQQRRICTDSDDGSDFFTAGSVSATLPNDPNLGITTQTQSSYFDMCSDGTSIDEYFCDSGQAQSENFECPYGCGQGACLCEDSDNGRNYFERGIYYLDAADFPAETFGQLISMQWQGRTFSIPAEDISADEASLILPHMMANNITLANIIDIAIGMSVNVSTVMPYIDRIIGQPSSSQIIVADRCVDEHTLEENYPVATANTCEFEFERVVCAHGCKYGACMSGTTANENNMAKYSDKEVFIVSDENWRDALRLVPLTTWKKNGAVQKYPFLIYHREGDNFDADSLVYFLQQYRPSRVTIFGETVPPGLLNLLIADNASGQAAIQQNPNRFTGAGLRTNQIRRYTMREYYSFWSTKNSYVISTDSYRTGLVASTFASMIDAPLLFDGQFAPDVINSKYVYVIGDISQRTRDQIAERAVLLNDYSFAEAQQQIVNRVTANKAIVVNYADRNITLNGAFNPVRGGGRILNFFGGMSLAAPTLAAAKSGVLLPIYQNASPENPNCARSTVIESLLLDTDDTIEAELSRFRNPASGYLTIFASPKAIPDSFYRSCSTNGNQLRTAFDWRYGSQNDTGFQRKVGRIYGITVTDASAYVARDIFYDELSDVQSEYTGLSIGHTFRIDPINAQTIKIKTSNSGYTSTCYGDNRTTAPSCTTRKSPGFGNYTNKKFITFADHGASNRWVETIRFDQLPWLDVPYSFAMACSTNNYWEGNTQTFGAHMLRRGAIGYHGAVGVTAACCTERQAIKNLTARNPITLGTLNKQLENDGNFKIDYILIGDPSIIPIFKEVDWS